MEVSLKENERIDDLECQGLKIIQNERDFCFGIDSVLLSNFANKIRNNSMVLDLGTGTGVIGILLSVKTKLKKIIGVEIQSKMCDMARRSIQLNDLEDKFEILEADIKELDQILENNVFDAIVTNPPYKKERSGLLNEQESKVIARHEVKCNLEDIARVSSKLLKDNGSVFMVHRPERLVDIFTIFRMYKLEPKNIQFVYTREKEAPKLVLIEAHKYAKSFLKFEKPLIIYEKANTYTEEILEIYGKERKS